MAAFDRSGQTQVALLDESGRSSHRRAVVLLMALSALSWLLIIGAIAIAL